LLPQRKALIAFLTSKEAPQLPKVESGSKAPEGSGTVSSNLGDGYLVLVPKGKKLEHAIRLVWNKGDKETKRPVEAGEYQVRRYVIWRKDDKDVEWNIWATGQGRSVVVLAGEETKLEMDLDLEFKNSSNRHGDRVSANGYFVADGKMGASLVKGDDRVVVGFKILIDNKEAGSGTTSYG
jgi:hypothetical protein